jgi:hypothetical protein
MASEHSGQLEPAIPVTLVPVAGGALKYALPADIGGDDASAVF